MRRARSNNPLGGPRAVFIFGFAWRGWNPSAELRVKGGRVRPAQAGRCGAERLFEVRV